MEPRQPPPFFIDGSIQKDGQPVTGVWVSARTVTGEEKWYATKTDENGDYHFDLPDGEYLIEGIWIDTQSKWYPKVISFTVKDGVLLNQSTVVIDLTLGASGKCQWSGKSKSFHRNPTKPILTLNKFSFLVYLKNE